MFHPTDKIPVVASPWLAGEDYYKVKGVLYVSQEAYDKLKEEAPQIER